MRCLKLGPNTKSKKTTPRVGSYRQHTHTYNSRDYNHPHAPDPPHPHLMPRSDSRQSTPSTVSLPDSLYSWSAQMYPGSSATSQWSEDGETVSPSHESWHKGDLIQLDSDGEGLRGVAHHANESLIDDPESEEDLPTPQDKLRQLLRQMQAEVHVNTEAAASPKRPIPPPRQPEPEPSSRRANWREGRRIGVYPPPSPGSGDDSPPTPPMRVTNPFTRRESCL